MSNPVLGRNAGRAVSALESTPNRLKFRLWPATLFVAGMATAWLPFGIGAAMSHGLDRMRSGSNANYELKVRAKYYAEQVGTTLGISPDRVGASDLLKAASINPALRRVVDEVEKERSAENRSSALINTGVGVASFVGLGGGAKIAAEVVNGVKVAKTGVTMTQQMAGQLAGGAVAGVLSKDEIKSQELIEATEKDIIRAKAQGLSAQAAINPQMTFMVRMAQDEALSGQINKLSKERFGHKFHKLDSQQMGLIMNHYPDLANATLREAHAIANGDMNIRDLAGAAPNMSGGFAGPMARSDNASRGSFVDKLNAQRAAASQQQGVNA